MSEDVMRSSVDSSINVVTQGNYPGFVEARYVRREPDHFIVYLSSQTGCAMRCKMCHLTQTAQFANVDVSLESYVDQAKQILEHYDASGQPAQRVHFNFMSRGEVFANRAVLSNADSLIEQLAALASARHLIPTYKFSTIMPRHTMQRRSLTDIFRLSQPDIYYSLYSLNPAFRASWLPNALDPYQALELLVEWQAVTHKLPILHWAFIEGENDSEADMTAIAGALTTIGLRADFNIVRYNPYDERSGAEPPETVVERNAELLRELLPASRVQVVKRVGFDVKASCGMFVEPPHA